MKIKKIVLGLVVLLALCALTYLFGPRPQFAPVTSDIHALDKSIADLDQWVANKESKVIGIKPENEARIEWADSIRQTDWAIVYLHGFSASSREGYPVHKSIAQKFGMNLYLARISGHGIDSPDSFSDLTPEDMLNSAKEAIAIGQIIGKKVILMSCSTGGTYSIYLAAHHPNLIDALVLYSPNIQIYDPNAKLMSGPWGLQLARAILGDYRTIDENIGTIKEQYTTSKYRVEGLVALQALIDQTMKESVFEKITQPVFLGYYYKNEKEQDKVVSVEAMRDFAIKINTSENDLRQVPFPKSGNHVICSDLHSADYQGVMDESSLFIEEVLSVMPKVSKDTLITF
jgi:pimeloyl-ACP methyl ester carboxylesterase